MSRLKTLRGESSVVDLNPKRGRIKKGIRPCLIVSTDAMNRSEFGTAIPCPITTTERPSFKWRVGLQPKGLRVADAKWEAEPHWVTTDQIVTIDTAHRAIRHLATVVNVEKLKEINSSLRLLLDL